MSVRLRLGLCLETLCTNLLSVLLTWRDVYQNNILTEPEPHNKSDAFYKKNLHMYYCSLVSVSQETQLTLTAASFTYCTYCMA